METIDFSNHRAYTPYLIELLYRTHGSKKQRPLALAVKNAHGEFDTLVFYDQNLMRLFLQVGGNYWQFDGKTISYHEGNHLRKDFQFYASRGGSRWLVTYDSFPRTMTRIQGGYIASTVAGLFSEAIDYLNYPLQVSRSTRTNMPMRTCMVSTLSMCSIGNIPESASSWDARQLDMLYGGDGNTGESKRLDIKARKLEARLSFPEMATSPEEFFEGLTEIPPFFQVFDEKLQTAPEASTYACPNRMFTYLFLLNSLVDCSDSDGPAIRNLHPDFVDKLIQLTLESTTNFDDLIGCLIRTAFPNSKNVRDNILPKFTMEPEVIATLIKRHAVGRLGLVEGQAIILSNLLAKEAWKNDDTTRYGYMVSGLEASDSAQALAREIVALRRKALDDGASS